ncbi:MAG TPA: RluA family pseudouridine synthase [Myxococcaceae bacterium]|nr:RluA family pseudouridine synthase [Myxococcaceae bacterium]
MTTVPVLHRGRAYVAVDKPAGVTVIPGRGDERTPSLAEQLERELGARVWIVHRLDRDTSGVLLFALDAASHRTLSMAFEAGRVEKRYVALVRGDVREPLDLSTHLAPARRGRMRPVRPGEEGKPARTLVRPLERFGGRATLLEAQPLTGRTHQIRVQLLAAGHPLLVDHQYGHKAPIRERDVGGAGEAVLLARTPLHAAHVRLAQLPGIEDAEIESPLPEDMRRTISFLRTIN